MKIFSLLSSVLPVFSPTSHCHNRGHGWARTPVALLTLRLVQQEPQDPTNILDCGRDFRWGKGNRTNRTKDMSLCLFPASF